MATVVVLMTKHGPNEGCVMDYDVTHATSDSLVPGPTGSASEQAFSH
jgi:hypothetical protein